MPELTLEHRFGCWWLWDKVAERGARLIGPYGTKAEAESDRRGLVRAYRASPEIYTSEPLETGA